MRSVSECWVGTTRPSGGILEEITERRTCKCFIGNSKRYMLHCAVVKLLETEIRKTEAPWNADMDTDKPKISWSHQDYIRGMTRTRNKIYLAHTKRHNTVMKATAREETKKNTVIQTVDTIKFYTWGIIRAEDSGDGTCWWYLKSSFAANTM